MKLESVVMQGIEIVPSVIMCSGERFGKLSKNVQSFAVDENYYKLTREIKRV